MTIKAIFARVIFLMILLATATLAFSQSVPPASEKADHVRALVDKATALIESKGKAAFAEFRVKDSQWFHGDTYLFVYDLQANVLLNPAFPAREGTNVSGQKDANGKSFHDAIISVAKTRGSGWVDYMLVIFAGSSCVEPILALSVLEC